VFELRGRRKRLLLTGISVLLVIPFIVPLYTMVYTSFQGRGIDNYKAALQLPGFWTYFRNSLLIAVATIAICYFLTMAASFGFSKLRIRSKEVYFWLMMGALTMPEVVLLTPMLMMAQKTGIGGTLWSVIIPLAAMQIPFTTLLTRSYVDGIPDSLFEAARIDGAGTWRQFWSILVPLAKPMGMAIIVLVLINSWNAYLLPLVLLPGEGQQVVSQLPMNFKARYTDDQPKVLAGATLAALPEIIAYVCLQKQFERGMAAGAIK
jgi:ABC-type glycerol-3-phosphate transport system permease component